MTPLPGRVRFRSPAFIAALALNVVVFGGAILAAVIR